MNSVTLKPLSENLDVTIINPVQDEISVLEEVVNESFKKFSEMSDNDRAFLNSLILRNKPKKLLELGVSKGASSVIMLNAIKNIKDAHLYSIDYNENHYKIPDKKTGFYVEEFPLLKANWALKTGGLALNFLDKIGGEIDFCLIDTVHENPGEILDFLMVLPYLKNGAIVVFHDTNLHLRTDMDYPHQYTNNLLMSAITGDKFIPGNIPFESVFGKYFNNIGAVRITEQTRTHIYEIFNLLTVIWRYFPKDEDIEKLKTFFDRFYPEYYCKYFESIVEKQKQRESELLESSRLKSNGNKSESFGEKIFSIRNYRTRGKKHKVVKLFGVKMKFRMPES